MDNRPFLWTRESSAHPMHSPQVLLPSAVPSFTQLPHSPTDPLGVTAFTRRGEPGRFVAEQWTAVWRSCGPRSRACGLPVDNDDRRLWTESASTGCGARSATNPQGADLGRRCPHIPPCGCDRDNSAVPRLWIEDRPQICGEPGDSPMYSNSARWRRWDSEGKRGTTTRYDPATARPTTGQRARATGAGNGRGWRMGDTGCGHLVRASHADNPRGQRRRAPPDGVPGRP